MSVPPAEGLNRLAAATTESIRFAFCIAPFRNALRVDIYQHASAFHSIKSETRDMLGKLLQDRQRIARLQDKGPCRQRAYH
jgi:hypothetical protein